MPTCTSYIERGSPRSLFADRPAADGHALLDSHLALLRPHKLACFVAFPVFLLTAYAGVISAMYHYAVVIKEDERFDFKMPSTPITT